MATMEWLAVGGDKWLVAGGEGKGTPRRK